MATTDLSIVPLLAVSFSVLKGFGVHEALETAMMKTLMPLGDKGVEIGLRIIEFVDNVKVGVLGSVGLALLLYTVLSLMQKIELAFNFIWLVPQERPLAQRFSEAGVRCSNSAISRVLCDARILNIFEGAAEIQSQVIARGLLSARN